VKEKKLPDSYPESKKRKKKKKREGARGWVPQTPSDLKMSYKAPPLKVLITFKYFLPEECAFKYGFFRTFKPKL
jgi:hypothetical protein